MSRLPNRPPRHDQPITGQHLAGLPAHLGFSTARTAALLGVTPKSFYDLARDVDAPLTSPALALATRVMYAMPEIVRNNCVISQVQEAMRLNKISEVATMMGFSIETGRLWAREGRLPDQTHALFELLLKVEAAKPGYLKTFDRLCKTSAKAQLSGADSG